MDALRHLHEEQRRLHHFDDVRGGTDLSENTEDSTTATRRSSVSLRKSSQFILQLVDFTVQSKDPVTIEGSLV